MAATALSISKLEKTYQNGFQALKSIDLTVPEGDFFALLGPNGAGKSTTIGIITSLVNKTSGKVSVFGYDLETQLSQAKRCLGLVPQEFNFSQFESPEQIVINQAGYYGIPRKQATVRAEEVLKQLGLWDKRSQPSRNLSGGMKRRLMIARALMHKPRLLILDEPTAGVDIELRRSMWEFLTELNEQGTTIVLTTHYLEEAESLCRNIAIIDDGQIIENTSKKDLLSKLDMETFVLDIETWDGELPELTDMALRKRDDHTLEVDVSRTHNVNNLFLKLNDAGIKVLSMRNKANRLEELFVRIVENKKQKQ
ncbi:ABC transporter ATP-binding protein [Pleionea mediterranea]|uniref:ABC-2 type transport system ATP-binding protein n=1 Tax=Pleionea mediterranea TaxID=523701 RepID=A0A316FPR1_9GAMM|nr:ABC transporter ATP-binding protein [Pleionea mediterranea]PWK50778.1 ABC-2 type transport system ATP-binding protein [Pleionea mediterranea]